MDHLDLAKKYWQALLEPEDLSIDATCGNGHDTLFLAGLSKVIGIDLQKEAIDQTSKLLQLNERTAVLHQMCHGDIDTLGVRAKLVVYNLGYLPGGDKSFTTKKETTLVSIEKALGMLSEEGALSITCYPGHPEGALEEALIVKWAAALPRKWSVCYHKWLNKTEKAPTLFWIYASNSLKSGSTIR